MFQQSEANRIWDRACHGGGERPLAGDLSLAALLKFHGRAMNAGALDPIEEWPQEALATAQRAYRYFGFVAVEELIRVGREAMLRDTDRDGFEESLDEAYHVEIPTDATLVTAFESHYKSHPEAYACLPDFPPPLTEVDAFLTDWLKKT